jgi:hypothetical protein
MLTKEQLEKAMRDAGLINPIARVHMPADRKTQFCLYAGPADARRTAYVTKSGNINDAAVKEAIGRLNGS